MFNRKLLTFYLLLFTFILCSFTLTIAQTATATLSGTVTDENSAAIAGAAVKVSNTATGFQRTVVSGDNGSFVVPLLPPSTYTVTIERTGFALFQANEVILNVGDQKALNVQLKVGQVNGGNVDVTSEPPLTNTSPAVSTTVDRTFVQNLPLNGRSFQSLITLAPGIVLTATSPSGNEPGQFSVNGQRSNANYFTIDGAGANVGVDVGLIAGEQTGGTLPALTSAGGTNNLVSVDALQEFNIQTSTYAAEFGRTPGGQISIATRSGTNDFHGTLFDYFRNDLFDANDWFNSANRQPKPATRQHDFGGVVGGPVYLPRLGEGGPWWYNGRNRTFFFFSYEGLRLQQPQAATTFVPSLSARQAAPAAVRPLLEAFPKPNGPENAVTGLAPFSASFSNPMSLDSTAIRLDHTIGKQSTVFGRYSHAPSKTLQRGGSSPLSDVFSLKTTTQILTLGNTYIFTPRLSNEARFNFSRVAGSSVADLDAFGGAVVPSDSFLFPSFASRENSVFSLLVSNIGPGNFFTVGSIAANLQRQINLIDNVSWNVGSHAFKFGIDYRRVMPVIAPRTYAQVNIANNIAQLLLGRSNFTQVQAESMKREPIFVNLSLYGQDTWRVNHRLTFSYGLRWEVNPAPREKYGNDPRTVTGFDSPSTTVLAPPGTPLYRTTYDNFAPRLGFAYQARMKSGRETIFRGGFGVFYDLGTGESSNAFSQGRFPYASIKTLIAPLLPVGPVDAAPAPFSATPSNSNIVAFDPNFDLPYTLQYSATLEQALGADQVISASYVGARGHGLLRAEGFSAAPSFSSVFVVRNAASSEYDSLQLQYRRRLSRGLQALVSYTFGKSLDTASNESTAFASVVRYDPEQDHGPSDFDIRHAFSGSVTYNIPTPHLGPFASAVLKSWSIDSIVKAQSAPPVNITTGASFLSISTIARPDLVGGVPIYIKDPSSPGGRRINRDAFVPVPLVGGTPSRQGTLGRNALRALPLFQVDLTMRRQFKLTERYKLQFAADFFNVLNHPNFGSVCSSFTTCAAATQFGRATRMFGRALGAGGAGTGFNPLYQVGGPRSMQFSLKLIY